MSKFSQEIEFMGSTVAHNMHEMQNILAIIHESAGLVEDILRINPDLKFQHRPKVEDTLSHIRSQVQRGKTVLHATSKLGHSIDQPLWETCDLNTYAQIGATLAQRMARLRNAEIVNTLADRPLPVRAGALAVLMQVYLGIDWGVGQQTEKRTLHLRTENGGSEHKVVIQGGNLPNQAAMDNIQVISSATRVQEEDNCLVLLFPAYQDGI